MNQKDKLFLEESNLIEGVGKEGLEDSSKAYLYLMQVQPPLTRKNVLKTHRLLMKNLNARIAGQMRKVPVGIYSKGKLVGECADPRKLEGSMTNFLAGVNLLDTLTVSLEKEEYSKECHILFEKMHPFEDGNGRVGRLLLAWQRKQMGLSLLIIFNDDKQRYYDWFK